MTTVDLVKNSDKINAFVKGGLKDLFSFLYDSEKNSVAVELSYIQYGKVTVKISKDEIDSEQIREINNAWKAFFATLEEN